MIRVATLVAVCLALFGGCSDNETPPPARTPPPVPTTVAVPQTVRSTDTVALLSAMASLTGARISPTDAATWAKEIDERGAPIATYIDRLIDNQRLGSEIAPALLFGSFVSVRNYYAIPSGFVLKRAPGTEVLYLRSPCAVAEAVTVRPWWNFSADVKVCPDAYRPTKWTIVADEHSYRTRTVLACDSQVGSPELETKSLCGCGPNLIRCLRDEEQYVDLNRSFMREIQQTTAHVVASDLPIATLFTSNETFRDANVELYYRRQKIGALEIADVERELADLSAWPRDGQYVPRPELHPGQHAGVLTTPQILHWLPDRRQRQRGYYEVLWCALRNSFGATTEKVLAINTSGNNFFTHDSWERLAHTELCTDCHARLDYGSRFFQGYPDSRASTHYTPALQLADVGPLYGQDIDDNRGEAPLTPLGFAKLATAQPEFTSCMARHISSYVLGDRATPDDVHEIEQVMARDGRFRPMMKIALERYAQHWRAPEEPTPQHTSTLPSTTRATGPIAVSDALREQLDRHCIDCHGEPGEGTNGVDLRGTTVPRTIAVRMAEMVAFGAMPKTGTLPAPTRDALVRRIIEALWSDPKAREEAERYYLGQGRGLPAHQVDNSLAAIDRTAGAKPELTWGALERGLWSDQATITPGLAALAGLEAVRACALSSGQSSAAFERCLRGATALSLLTRWPRGTPSSAAP